MGGPDATAELPPRELERGAYSPKRGDVPLDTLLAREPERGI